ncbi:hypothetical protein [Nocardia sp. NPDC004860]|uniref:hypothetical protein n=1 Tax=Nocardia sp. NPDC004860 TaxID=3154557 RepID=UPI0033BB5570
MNWWLRTATGWFSVSVAAEARPSPALIRAVPARLYVFDLLGFGGRDLRTLTVRSFRSDTLEQEVWWKGVDVGQLRYEVASRAAAV